SEGRFAHAGWTAEQHVIELPTAALGGAHRLTEVIDDFELADVVVKVCGAQRGIFRGRALGCMKGVVTTTFTNELQVAGHAEGCCYPRAGLAIRQLGVAAARVAGYPYLGVHDVLRTAAGRIRVAVYPRAHGLSWLSGSFSVSIVDRPSAPVWTLPASVSSGILRLRTPTTTHGSRVSAPRRALRYAQILRMAPTGGLDDSHRTASAWSPFLSFSSAH